MADLPRPRFPGYTIDFTRRDPICPGCGRETQKGERVYWIGEAWVCESCAWRADRGEAVNTLLVPRMEEEWGRVTMVPPKDCPEDRRFTPNRARELWPGYFSDRAVPAWEVMRQGAREAEVAKPKVPEMRFEKMRLGSQVVTQGRLFEC